MLHNQKISNSEIKLMHVICIIKQHVLCVMSLMMHAFVNEINFVGAKLRWECISVATFRNVGKITIFNLETFSSKKRYHISYFMCNIINHVRLNE